MVAEQIRVEEMSEAERELIGSLSPARRKQVLLQAARLDQMRLNETLFEEMLDQIRAGAVQPTTNMRNGLPYPTNGDTFWHGVNGGDGPLHDLGRVPEREELHVLRRNDGTLVIVEECDLRKDGEAWKAMTLAVWYDQSPRTPIWHGKYFSCRFDRNTGEFGPGWGTLTVTRTPAQIRAGLRLTAGSDLWHYRTFPLLRGSGSLMTFWANEYTKDQYELTEPANPVHFPGHIVTAGVDDEEAQLRAALER